MSRLDSFNALVQVFAPAFTRPTFLRFNRLLIAWIVTAGKRTITRLLTCPIATDDAEDMAGERTPHHAAFHRFFTRAAWCPDRLGGFLVKLLLPFLGPTVTLIVDDTLCRKSGPRILGAGMHHDPLRSSRGGAGKTSHFTALTFGINVVVLGVWVPVGFLKSGGICVPVLIRLYRSKRTCPSPRYRKRTDLAGELLAVAAPWLADREVVVVGDREYACKTVLQQLPVGIGMVGPLPMDAILHDIHVVKNRQGRPRLWGERVPTPTALASDRRHAWRKTTVTLYGRSVTIMIKTISATWLRGGPHRPLRVVVTRDPKGRWKDNAYFSTRLDDAPEAVLIEMARRWTMETAFRDAKQCLGLETPQNGWTRRRRKPRRRREGPHADNRRSPLGTWRTTYFGLFAYGLVVVWYLRHGDPAADVSTVRAHSPWYRQKRTVSFGDMWRALSCALWSSHFSDTRTPPGHWESPPPPATAWLIAS